MGRSFWPKGQQSAWDQRGAQHWSCGARAGNQHLQTWSALGARRQGCRALGACQPWRTTALRSSWREVLRSGGMKPKHWGFGRQVIQRLTAQGKKGKVTREFLPGGVRWKLDSSATFQISARSAATAYIDGTITEQRACHVSQESCESD